jgi:CheY-like chemotaxis protein
MPLILIVDDLSFERQRVREILKHEGYACAEAANGREALALINERRPDCVLSDLVMPEMDGFELLGALQERERQIPVIVLTADAQAATREECERLGAVAVLHKTPNSQVLGEILQNVLRAQLGAAGGISTAHTYS